MMQYKGYLAQVELDPEAKLLHGEVVNIRDVVTFQAGDVAGLERAFHESVDDYLAFCDERGEEPDKPFSGKFVARVSPSLHRRLSSAAAAEGLSLNAWVSRKLERAVSEEATSTSKERIAVGVRRVARTSRAAPSGKKTGRPAKARKRS